MTKIMHATSVHNRFDNRIFRKQCVDLAAFGYDVTLLVADGYGNSCVEGVEVRDCRRWPIKSRLFRIFFMSPYVAFSALRSRANLYHIHDPELMFFFFIMAPFFPEKKLVFDMHENLSEQIKTKLWIPKICRLPISFLIRWYERILLRCIPVVYAEASYSKFYPNAKKYQIVMNFPKAIWSDLRKTQATTGAPPTIGYVGRIGVDRGVDTLLASVATINKAGRAMRLVLIGTLPDDVCQTSDFHYLNALGMLNTPGFVENHRAVELVRSWDIGFCVLNAHPNFVESYPTKLFEYIAAGVPVIASNFPLYERLISETGGGICIQPGRVDLLVQAIIEILHEPDRFKAKFDSDKYSWGGQFSKLIQFYSEIL